jgi:5-methylcytosine-specific restriction endonuclease McrA
MSKSAMIFRCRNGFCSNEIDPEINKYCSDCAKKCSEYFCCNGHYFNREQVKNWIGTNTFPRSQAICPFCHPNGFLKKDDIPPCPKFPITV